MAVAAIATFAVGFIGVLIVYGFMGGGGSGSDFEPQITETRSEGDAGPFNGGARLSFPVDSIDFGHVPLNTEVSYAFALTNVGDAEAKIKDVTVTMLEGC